MWTCGQADNEEAEKLFYDTIDTLRPLPVSHAPGLSMNEGPTWLGRRLELATGE